MSFYNFCEEFRWERNFTKNSLKMLWKKKGPNSKFLMNWEINTWTEAHVIKSTFKSI